MNVNLIKNGMRLIIMKIDQTDATFTSGSSMRSMVGKVYTVDHVSYGSNEVRLGGWSWHSDDLETEDYQISDSEISEAMSQEKTLFNPNELIT